MQRSTFSWLVVVLIAVGAVAWFMLRDAAVVDARGTRSSPLSADDNAANAASKSTGALVATRESATALPNNAALAGDATCAPWPKRGIDLHVVDEQRRGVAGALVTWVETHHARPEDSDGSESYEVDEVLRRFGRRYRADEQGRARVPTSADVLVLVAQAEARSGQIELAAATEGQVEISIHPDRTFSVRVIDESGRAVVGAPLKLWSGTTLFGVLRGDVLTRAPDGLVEFAPIDLLANRGDAEAVLRIVLDYPQRARREIELPIAELARALPREPPTIVVPSTGALELLFVDANDQPVKSPIRGHVESYLGPPSDALHHAENSNRSGNGDYQVSFAACDGHATIDRVETGLWFDVQSSVVYGDWENSFGPGPQRAGETARIVVRVNSIWPGFHGRAVDEQGRPLARTPLVLLVLGSGRRELHDFPGLRTDELGRFHVMNHDLFDQEPTGLGFLARAHDGEPLRVAECALTRDAIADGADFGDVVLRPRPVLAAGVVVDRDGEPIADATIDLNEQDADGTTSCIQEWRARSNERGEFELRGECTTKEPWLVACDERFHPSASVAFTPGATNLRIVLERVAALSGRVLLDPGLPTNCVTIEERFPGYGTEGGAQLRSAQLQCDGSFVIGAAVASKATIAAVAFMSDRSATIAEIPDVQLTDGEVCRDPRLDPIDLRGRILGVALTIVDEDGSPIAAGNCKVPRYGEEGDFIDEAFVHGAHRLLFVPPLPEIDVSAEGFRPEHVLLSSPATRVVMRRAIPIVVELDPALVAPPPPIYLQCVFSEKPLEEIDDEGFMHCFPPDHVVRVYAARPGPHHLKLITFKSDSFSGYGWCDVDGSDVTIEVADTRTPQHFTLTCKPEALKEAIGNVGE